MKFVLTVLFCFLPILGNTKIKNVTYPSAHIGKTYTTQVPLLYIKNLPYLGEVSYHIENNTSVLMRKDINAELSQFRNICGGCLSADLMVTPIRLDFIPVGTQLKVVDEFFYESLGSVTHFFVIEDNNGIRSQILGLTFDLYVVKSTADRFRPDARMENVLTMINMIKEGKYVHFIFNIEQRMNPNPDIEKFIRDFKLEDDLEILIDEITPTNSTVKYIEPKSIEALLTAYYYFPDWRIYGTFIPSQYNRADVKPATYDYQDSLEGTYRHR